MFLGDFRGREESTTSHFYRCFKKKKIKKIFFGTFIKVISLGRVVVTSQKKLQTLPGPIRSYPVRENHIGSVFLSDSDNVSFTLL